MIIRYLATIIISLTFINNVFGQDDFSDESSDAQQVLSISGTVSRVAGHADRMTAGSVACDGAFRASRVVEDAHLAQEVHRDAAVLEPVRVVGPLQPGDDVAEVERRRLYLQRLWRSPYRSAHVRDV